MATFCTSAAIKLKAGNSAATLTATQYDLLTEQAESVINTAAKHNFTDVYATLNDDTKKILEDAASSNAAASVIAYNTDGFTRLGSANFAANVNWTRYEDCINKLKDQDYKDFVVNA